MANISNTFLKELKQMNKTPHKHAALIKAWADGAVIQYKTDAGTWADVYQNQPSWYTDNTEYRIKPEEKPKKVVRVAIIRDKHGTFVQLVIEKQLEIIRNHPQFVRWLTDTIEYEAE